MAAADQPLTAEIRPARAAAGLLLALAAAALASVLAWCAGQSIDTPMAQGWAAAACTFATVVVAAALWAPRQPTLLLGWDGRQWWLAHPRGGRESPHWSGELRLVWRIGRCWVLRGQGEPARIWLTVDAAALGVQAHALLCALYCARRRPGVDPGP